MEANKQITEKPELGDGNTLEIVNIWKTIQGEGPFVGIPATFVRVAGCNFRCLLCDTNYTSDRQSVLLDNLVASIVDYGLSLVVITGGEPFRQNIGPLVERLSAHGLAVQIETNGSLSIDTFPWGIAQVVCSPKSPKVHPDIASRAIAWKYVIEAGYTDEDGFPNRILGVGMRVARPPDGFSREQIYIQPLDEKEQWRNDRHRQAAVDICLTHGYRLCLQIQKIVGVK